MDLRIHQVRRSHVEYIAHYALTQHEMLLMIQTVSNEEMLVKKLFANDVDMLSYIRKCSICLTNLAAILIFSEVFYFLYLFLIINTRHEFSFKNT